MNIIEVLISLVIISIAIFIFVTGVGKYERAECLEWQDQKEKFELWYATDWQKEQCKQFGIEL